MPPVDSVAGLKVARKSSTSAARWALGRLGVALVSPRGCCTCGAPMSIICATPCGSARGVSARRRPLRCPLSFEVPF